MREVPLESLAAGAVVEVRAGDSIPADGVVIDGTSTLDRSLLTGESLPEEVVAGDPVHAGTVNLSAPPPGGGAVDRRRHPRRAA